MKGDAAGSNYDFTLVATAIVISLIGVVLISSATYNKPALSGLWMKQLTFLGIGIVLLVLFSMINYRVLIRYSMIIYALSIGLLLILIVYGKIAGGARSWISIGGLSFQPSEFVKIAVILVLAQFFSKAGHAQLDLLDLFKPGFLIAIPVMLTAAQPDLGTAVTMLPLFLGMAIVAGLRLRSIIALILIGLILFAFAWFFLLQDYQKERIRSFWNPNDDLQASGYQIQQSLIAIGSGGLMGKGLYLGSQSQLNFVPAQHTDFIFSVLGEELGFFAVAVVLFLYMFLFVRALLPLRQVHDIEGVYIIIGVVCLLAFQTLVNVMMSIGLFPTTGVPLPFLSYGGSSLLTCLICIGLVVSVLLNQAKNSQSKL